MQIGIVRRMGFLMDADRIRQAVVDSTCATCPKVVEGGMERVIDAQAEVREAALDYADLLDGPTDEDVEVLAKASRHTFQDRNGEWQNVVTQADLDEARRLLEAVFQARKERK